MMRGRRYALATVLLIGQAATVGWAQSGKERSSADIRIWAIRATTRNNEISPELRGIADKLKKQFKYTGFKLERRVTGEVQLGRVFEADLIGGYEAKVTLKKHDGERITLQVQVLRNDKPVLDATISLPVKGSQLIGGWSVGDGEALIVAVSAR
jgi:hypothetical protein